MFLGPKLYISTRDARSVGTTCLHIDATEAINVLTYSTDNTKAALWLIYTPEDAPKLSNWLRSRFPNANPGDIIHQRWAFITPDMEEDILRDIGVQGFKFTQHVGEAVLIPAGAPHQVESSLITNIRSDPTLTLTFRFQTSLPASRLQPTSARPLALTPRSKSHKSGVTRAGLTSYSRLLCFGMPGHPW